eukprot:m.869586 g.869586  ORF g.869586 m.869586 type:complete len:258 (+) comp59744_c0_seq21:1742-2515(+)
MAPSRLRVHILGTGSAEPSKCRASSAIYLDFFQRGGMLVDAGEEALHLLDLQFGRPRRNELIQSLACVWISHLHADHCTGLLSIVVEHHSLRGARSAPLTLIAPFPVFNWLSEALWAIGFDPSTVIDFIHCRHTSGPPTTPLLGANLQQVCQQLGLTALTSVPVTHCYDSYGLVLETMEGFKLVYSGDTRPSEASPAFIAARVWCFISMRNLVSGCRRLSLPRELRRRFSFTRPPLSMPWPLMQSQRGTRRPTKPSR